MKKLLILLLPLLVWACSGTGDERNTQSTYVITALLTAGQMVNADNPIYVTSSVNLDHGNILDMSIQNAIVAITDSTSGQVYPLTYVGLPVTDTQSLGYYCDTSGTLLVQPQHTYRIDVQIEQNHLWAITTVPPALAVVDSANGFTANASGPYPQVAVDSLDAHHPLYMYTSPGYSFHMFMETYCLEEDYHNLEYSFPILGQDKPKKQEDYEDPINHSPRRLRWYYDYLTDNNGLARESSYQTSFAFKHADYYMKVLSIDDNYYRYLYKPEGYKYGGVNGGYGYFGSGCGVILYTHLR